MRTNISFCVSISESATAAAAAEAMTMNKHSDICHTNEFKLDERSSMISGGIRGAQAAATRCIPPSRPLDLSMDGTKTTTCCSSGGDCCRSSK